MGQWKIMEYHQRGWWRRENLPVEVASSIASWRSSNKVKSGLQQRKRWYGGEASRNIYAAHAYTRALACHARTRVKRKLLPPYYLRLPPLPA